MATMHLERDWNTEENSGLKLGLCNSQFVSSM